MLPQKAVKAIIVYKDKLLLLQRNPLVRDNDNWDLPGGLVEDSETEENALLREVREELNIDIEIIRSAGEWSFLRHTDQKVVIVKNYLSRISSDNFDLKLSNEHQAYRWILPEEIKNFNLKDDSLKENIVQLVLL